MGFEPHRIDDGVFLQRLKLEDMLVGAILNDPAEFYKCNQLLEDMDWVSLTHLDVWRAMQDVFDSGEIIHLVSVTSELARTGMLEQVGGFEAVARLYMDYFTGIGASAVANKIHAYGVKARGIQEKAKRINEILKENVNDTDQPARTNRPYWEA